MGTAEKGDLALHARRRARAIAGVFVAVQVLVVLFGAIGLEGLDILRSYAAGESHWSKGQKAAIISLHRYAETRSELDYRNFENALSVVDGDRTAREILKNVNLFGTAEERARAEQGFVKGGNNAVDAPGLVWGFLLFHRWDPFESAVDDWARGDMWAARLLTQGRGMREAARRGAGDDEFAPFLSTALRLDGKLSENEAGYARHMGEASRIAERATLVAFISLSLLACSIGVLSVWRITKAGLRAETRVIESEARVRDYAELSSDWFCELDKDLRISFVASRLSTNSTALDRQFEGRGWSTAGIDGGFEAETPGHLKTLRAHQPFRGHRFKQTLPDGGIQHWSVSGKPMFDGQGNFAGYRTTGVEISDMVRAQEEIAHARDEAQRANRAKSAFLANMSHELRTPLNAILGFSGFIEHQALGEISNKRYVEYAGDIRESGEHLLAIINDLLEHSRIEAGKAELREGQFDIAAVIEQAQLFCRSSAEKAKVTFRVRVAEGLPPIFGDELRLRQVLINLISNAVKFTPDGTVDISARTDANGDLRVDVRDTGIGMDEAGIAQALKPFGQVDSGLSRKFEGTGLGLPLAKSLVELHGGKLSIESEQGHGTSVSIVLPAWRVGADKPAQVMAA